MVPLYRAPVECVQREEWGFFNLAGINSYFEIYGIAAFWKILGPRGPKVNKRHFRSRSVGWNCAGVKTRRGGRRKVVHSSFGAELPKLSVH